MRPEIKKGQEWKNRSTTIRIEEVLPNGAKVGSVMADGSLARRRLILASTLHASYWLIKEAS